MNYFITVYGYKHKCEIVIKLLDYFEDHMYLHFNENSNNNLNIKDLVTTKMNALINVAKNAYNRDIRIMEER
jgi:hypothetical protein